MSKQTVDYGIDLGTTNSGIARMERRGPRVVKSRYQSDTIPSAVAVSPSGQILVGEDAIKDISRLKPALQFKRLMGTNTKIAMADGSEWNPVSLSAEVLKELKASVKRRYDEELTHVVITVPAMFQQPQCEATYQAARLAGLEAVALIQEPIAAATAYLSESAEDGYYMVYDLGGGTFDVSIVQVRLGEMHVVVHGGDNFLGGGDFDKRIYEWVTQQVELGYGHRPAMHTPEGRWILMRECERAKIRLTDEERTIIDLSYFNLPIAKIDIDRAILHDLIEDLVEKTIFLAKMRLEESRISPDEVVSVLLVGGPTQMPYIRQRLRDELGIETRLEDPMTIVALGAAVHASTILKPTRTKPSVPGTATVELELHYEPVSPDSTTPIAGRVVTPPNFTGEIRLATASGDWETGWIRLQNGAFTTELMLNRDAVTVFNITVRDAQGNLHSPHPESISIRWGTAPPKAVAPYHYGVALDDGTMDIIIEAGTALPAYGRPKLYRTNRTIQAGSDDEFVVYFLEGRSRFASDNIKVGELRLTGKHFKHTLKENEKVEIRMRMDESRRLSARVYIPIFDQEFPVNLVSAIYEVSYDALVENLSKISEMIKDIEAHVGDEDREQLLRTAAELERLETEVSRSQHACTTPAEELVQRVAHVKQELRELHNRYKPVAEYNQTRELLDFAEQVCVEFNDRMGQAAIQDLRKELERCKRLGDIRAMNTIREQVVAITHPHLTKTGEFWVCMIVWLRQQASFATNRTAFLQAVEQIENSLQRGDIRSAKLYAHRAFQYLPDSEDANPYKDAILRL
jgi:molecular chaperone DnaK